MPRNPALNTHCPERNAEIDLHLAVMCAVQVPGQCVSHEAINQVTGLSHFGSNAIERRALAKLGRRLVGLRQEFSA